jgi:hypothetical protein
MDPDERRRYAAQRAEWAKNAREFETNYLRLKALWREEDERRERRRRLLRGLVLFRRHAA